MAMIMLSGKFLKIGACAAIMLLLGIPTALQYSNVVYTESGEAFSNPYMGYAPWASSQTPEYVPEPDFNLAFAVLIWKDFEPEKGAYDFEAFETRNNFGHLRSNGVKLIIRFVSDYPSDKKHMDIPQWLYDEAGGAGAFYSNNGLCGFAPDYANEIIIERHRLAIKALADRYDSSAGVAFVQLGSLGQWGEWHNWVASSVTQFPDSAVCDIYARHYLSSFKQTLMQMRRPFEIARENNMGFYNDMIGNSESTDHWLGWISESGMGDFYKYAPSGGEFASTSTVYDYFGSMYGDLKQMTADSHTTFIGGYPPVEYKENGDDLLKIMGYRFVAVSAFYRQSLLMGQGLPIIIMIKNTGVAPFYYKWSFRLMFYDSGGVLAYSFEPPWDPREIQPGEVKKFSALVPQSLPKGEYTVTIGLASPSSQVPEVRFANIEANGGPLLTIGKVKVG